MKEKILKSFEGIKKGFPKLTDVSIYWRRENNTPLFCLQTFTLEGYYFMFVSLRNGLMSRHQVHLTHHVHTTL